MLAVGGVRVINGLMTPGSLVAMFRYLGMLIWPLMGAGFMVNMIQRGAVSLGRINEIMKTEPSIKDNFKDKPEDDLPKLLFSESLTPAVEITDLEFSYNDKKVLDGINLKIERGQWLGIMGKTGSGKSTLAKTFMRMIDPPQGCVKIFGLDVRDWPLESLRSLFAVSPQDSYLFSDTIANNIMYGKGEDTEVIREEESVLNNAINLASLNKDMENFQYGKDTLVGERGLTLSGGQKQRTAIARAAIMNAEFLVLDDSLSAVDNETEQKILLNLLNERKNAASGKNCTTIIISHRVSSLKYADNVLVLDKGKILEYGSPAELVSAGGYYSRMAAFQRLECGTEIKNG